MALPTFIKGSVVPEPTLGSGFPWVVIEDERSTL